MRAPRVWRAVVLVPGGGCPVHTLASTLLCPWFGMSSSFPRLFPASSENLLCWHDERLVPWKVQPPGAQWEDPAPVSAEVREQAGAGGSDPVLAPGSALTRAR